MSEITEIRVLKACAKALQLLDSVSYDKKDKDDAIDFRGARARLANIINNNGYHVTIDGYKLKKGAVK
jgi:hypothetical protein